MTSIQLPPLQFEDGGFRVSIITGPSTANAPGASEAKPVSDTESEPNSEPERDQNQDAHVTPEPQRIPPPQPLPLKLEVPVEYSTKAEPEVESEPKPHHDSKPDPDTETTPVAVSKPAPIPVPESTPVPKPELEAVAASTTAPAPESEVVDVPTCLLVGHHEEDLPAPEETPQPPSVPQHPIGSLQRAFAESLDEVTKGGADKPRLRDLDAKARRERLLEQDKDEEPFDARWRYRPGQTQHEVPKLISQISFGVYLLLNGMANDNSQVISILQGHIDEVDEFLEVTLEDFAQAATDLNERLDYLKLPMSNVKVFEEMLEDRNYRAEILEGNEKIEQVLARMNVIMKQWEGDIEAGLQGTAAFNEWLNSLRSGSWRHEHPELVEIFDAMRGNAEGWLNAFDEMDSKTRSMNGLITQLMTIVAEMERKAGEVSRKTWVRGHNMANLPLPSH